MVESSNHDYLAKVIIIGDTGVGKTNLLTQFCQNQFQDNYVATIGVDFKLKTVQIDKTKIKMQIWDTAGQERFRNITQTYFKGACAIILAYQINSRSTFDNMNMWIRQVEANSDEEVVKLLIGTKIDLQGERQVQTREGKELAYKHRMIFEEVSAKCGINVEKAFLQMAKEIKERKVTNRWQVQNTLGLLLKTSTGIKKKQCHC